MGNFSTVINEQGNKYGRLLVISRADPYKKGDRCLAQWNCICDCGIQCIALGNELRSGHKQSCGCLKRQRAVENCKTASDNRKDQPANNSINEMGNRFGKLVVIEQLPTRHKKSRWRCLCDCGKYKKATGDSLRQGKVSSCGCIRKDIVGGYTTTSTNNKFSQYKANAKRRNLDFSISFEFFEKTISSGCAYCGGMGGGVDRWDNSLGYTETNSVPCCMVCNRMKLTWNPLEFLVHCNKIVENHKHNVFGT